MVVCTCICKNTLIFHTVETQNFSSCLFLSLRNWNSKHATEITLIVIAKDTQVLQRWAEQKNEMNYNPVFYCLKRKLKGTFYSQSHIWNSTIRYNPYRDKGIIYFAILKNCAGYSYTCFNYSYFTTALRQ